MFSILILLFFVQLILCFLSKTEGNKWRESWIKSVVILFATVVGSTEFLSYFYLLKTNFVIAWWCLLNLLAFGYLFFFLKIQHLPFLTNWTEQIKTRLEWFTTLQSKLFLFIILSVYSVVFMTAILAPPNTVDALTYHLARVAHWIQTGSVEFFQTHNDRQLFNAPLSEYFILHLQILTGSDRLANLVQFFSFFSCGLLTTLIAQMVKLDRLGQLFTLLVSATLPMGMIQASSSKNDLVTALFVVAFFYFLKQTIENKSGADSWFAGISLGLALLTKGNAFFFCLPIGVLFFIKSIVKFRLTKPQYSQFLKFGLILIIALTINFGHFYRNWQVYQTPVTGEDRLKNEKLTLPILFSNFVRNYSIHIGIKDNSIRFFIRDTISDFLGEEVNNPASTLDVHKFTIFQVFNEESTGNMLHLFFLTVGFIYAFLTLKGEEKSHLIYLSLSILFGLLVLCAVLKWNYYLSRIHSPLFLLGSTLISFFVYHKLNKTLTLISFVFFISAFFTLYAATPRTLIPYDVDCVYLTPRSEMYYVNNKNLEPIHVEAMDFIKKQNPDEIGLDLSTDYVNYNFGDWEYNFWILLKDDFAGKPYLRHVGVDNPSNKLKPNLPMPEWVISTKKNDLIENVEYEVAWKKGSVRILHKKVGQ